MASGIIGKHLAEFDESHTLRECVTSDENAGPRQQNPSTNEESDDRSIF